MKGVVDIAWPGVEGARRGVLVHEAEEGPWAPFSKRLPWPEESSPFLVVTGLSRRKVLERLFAHAQKVVAGTHVEPDLTLNGVDDGMLNEVAFRAVWLDGLLPMDEYAVTRFGVVCGQRALSFQRVGAEDRLYDFPRFDAAYGGPGTAQRLVDELRAAQECATP